MRFVNSREGSTMQDNQESRAGNRGKVLSPAAQRALEEAEDRRRREAALNLPKEVGGRGGAEPVRFGDWEIDGRAIDF